MKAALAGGVKTIAPMLLGLERHPPGLTGVVGELTIDGAPFTHTLERLPTADSPCIPAGLYRVVLTESDRAKRGLLWCPGADRKPPDYRLPLLLSVPGREGIRMHAANSAADLRGCIGVGSWHGGEFLTGSRSALSSLIDMLDIAEISRRPIHIEVKDA